MITRLVRVPVDEDPLAPARPMPKMHEVPGTVPHFSHWMYDQCGMWYSCSYRELDGTLQVLPPEGGVRSSTLYQGGRDLVQVYLNTFHVHAGSVDTSQVRESLGLSPFKKNTDNLKSTRNPEYVR